MKLSSGKPYKHIRLVPLSNIKRVIDIKEGDGKFLAEHCIIHHESLKYLFVLAPILKFLKWELSVSNVIESMQWNPMWEGNSCFDNQVISYLLSTQIFITFYNSTWTLFWAK